MNGILTEEECMARIRALPQARSIKESDAIQWVRRTLSIDPDRIAWHIKRAGGIGGSEAGCVMAWRTGEFAARETAERLACRKLLMVAPDRPNADTGRGHKMEPIIKMVYEERLERNGHSWKSRDDLRAIVEASAHPGALFMRASLDGFYEIDGNLVITDFKAPSEAALEGYVQHLDFHEYRMQLNHYAMVAAGHGITVDRMELAFFDYRNVAFEGVRVFDIGVDPSLQERIMESQQAFWDGHVMQGLLPEGPREKLMKGEVPDDIEHRARRAVTAKMLGDKFSKEYEQDRKAITRWVSGHGRLEGGTLPLGSFAQGMRGFLDVKGEPKLDVQGAVDRLRDLGMGQGDIEALRKPQAFDLKKVSKTLDVTIRLLARARDDLEGGKENTELANEIGELMERLPVAERSGYDAALVSAALESMGEIPYHYTGEDVSAGLPRKKSRDLDEHKDVVGKLGDELMDMLVPCIRMPDNSEEAEPGAPTPGR